MKVNEKITYKEVVYQASKNKAVSSMDNGNAAVTHYIYNSQNRESKYYKQEALAYVKKSLSKKP